MRIAIYVAAIAGLASLAPQTARGVAASAASVLFEALPYLALSLVLVRVFGRFGGWAGALAGCGCGRGGARSVPAALAAAALFGPGIALARWIAASLISAAKPPSHDRHDASLLDDLLHLAPSAVLCGIVVAFAPQLHVERAPLALQLVIGACIGVFASPCTLGGVALAASLHAHTAPAAYAVLATSGVVDVPLVRAHVHVGSDRTAYALLAVACSLVAVMHGDALVHPRMTIPLGCCAALFGYSACRSSARSR